MYERTVDLMDERAFPREMLDWTKKNPRNEISEPSPVVEQNDAEMIAFVVNKMTEKSREREQA